MKSNTIVHTFLLLLLASPFGSSAQALAKNNAYSPSHPPSMTLTSYSQLEAHKNTHVKIEGVLLQEPFMNKGGRVFDYSELVLELNDRHRILVSNHSGEPMSKHPITHRVLLEGFLFYGLLDTDDPNVQSRVGYRIEFKTLTQLRDE